MTAERVWRAVDCRANTDELDGVRMDTITVGLQSEGQVYAVSVTGPTGMSITAITDALRATLYYGLKGAGCDLTDLKVRVPAPGELDAQGKPN